MSGLLFISPSSGESHFTKHILIVSCICIMNDLEILQAKPINYITAVFVAFDKTKFKLRTVLTVIKGRVME